VEQREEGKAGGQSWWGIQAKRPGLVPLPCFPACDHRFCPGGRSATLSEMPGRSVEKAKNSVVMDIAKDVDRFSNRWPCKPNPIPAIVPRLSPALQSVRLSFGTKMSSQMTEMEKKKRKSHHVLGIVKSLNAAFLNSFIAYRWLPNPP
jgi:hypothetical protein